MADTSCAFTTIDQVLATARLGHMNITTIVSSCPGICTLAWGSGNPDLSGIGANISYIFQAILTIFFGPIFSFVRLTSGKPKNSPTDLQDLFLDVSAQFSIIVAIAAVIRFYLQSPSFYELAFLRSLTTMQLLSVLSTAVTVGIFKNRRNPKDAPRMTLTLAYVIIQFVLYISLIPRLYAIKTSRETFSELGDICQPYSHISPWYAYIPTPKVHLPDLSGKEDHSNQLKLGGILFGFITAGLVGFHIGGRVLGGLGLIFYMKPNYRVLASLGFAIGMLVEVAQMENTRNVMKAAVSGVQFHDDQWGFGQVIALLLWAPLFIQTIYYRLCLFYS